MYLTEASAANADVDDEPRPAKMRPSVQPGDLDVSSCSGAEAEAILGRVGLLGAMEGETNKAVEVPPGTRPGEMRPTW